MYNLIRWGSLFVECREEYNNSITDNSYLMEVLQ